MTRFNFHGMEFQKRAAQRQYRAPAELIADVAADVHELLKGIGRTRYSPAAAKYMAPEPARRIDPNSPEGRAIAARYTG